MKKCFVTQTYLCGQSFFCDQFECVNHRDVAEPSGNGEGAVSILTQISK